MLAFPQIFRRKQPSSLYSYSPPRPPVPDFRSPDTGLYANLAALDLPEPEAVFDLSFFRQNPQPFYVLAKELYPGERYRPTISHVFISLLARKGLLHMLFTQNIDCLERAAGIPGDRIVEAHGSFASQRCIECRTPLDDETMRDHVRRAAVPRCPRGPAECGGLVKPDIVFFGESLPRAFFELSPRAQEADLVLVMGTSLLVHPFAALPNTTPRHVPRVLFNLERVGTFGTQADDVLVLGDCDAGVRRLADELGWRDELERTWRELVGDEEADRQLQGGRKRSEALHDEVNKLAEEVEEVLHVQDGEEGAEKQDARQDDEKSEAAAEDAEERREDQEPKPAGEEEPRKDDKSEAPKTDDKTSTPTEQGGGANHKEDLPGKAVL